MSVNRTSDGGELEAPRLDDDTVKICPTCLIPLEKNVCPKCNYTSPPRVDRQDVK